MCAGPTPWSPLGCAATLLVWHRRGTVAPLLPYKVTFVGLYFLLNAGAIGCRLSELTTTGEYEPSAVCDLVRSDGRVDTLHHSISLQGWAGGGPGKGTADPSFGQITQTIAPQDAPAPAGGCCMVQ